jgi:signal peptidase I
MKKKKYLLALLAIIVLFIAASLFLREQGDQLKTSQVKSGSIKKTIEEEDEKIETVCHFCNKKYLFEGDKLKNLL